MAMGRMTRVPGALTRWGLGACALLAVLLALYASLGRVLVPLVAEYRADIERKVSEAVGVPVRIGALEGRWLRLSPMISLHDVQIGEGQSSLRLDDVKAVPDLWGSLKAREVRLANLQVSGVQLIVRENQEGRWTLEGLPQRDDVPSDPAQILKQLRQLGRVDLFDSQVTLHPWQREPLTLTYVELGLRAGSQRQSLEMRATLPDGQPLSAVLHGQARAEQWRDGAVQAYVSLPQAEWAQWIPPRLLGAWQADRLQAGGQVWLEWGERRLQKAVVRVQAPQLRGAHEGRKPISVKEVALSAWLERNAQGLAVQVDSLAARIGETPWQARLKLQQTDAQTPEQELWQVQADRIDLTPLTPVIHALAPLPEPAMKAVDALQVTGALRNLRLDLRPKAEGDQRAQFAANLEQVGFDAYHGAPGAGNVSGSIQGDLGHGELRLDSEAFMLHLYPIFAKPWHYEQANARLTWTLNKQSFTLVAPYLKVKGKEGNIAGDFLIRLFLEPGHEDYMDLRVGLTDGDGRYTAKYLPEVLGDDVDKWLRTAILQGDVDEGYFQYQGSLHHDAPAHSRTISLFFAVRNAVLDFQPGWPHLQQVDGKVYVDDTGVRVVAERGRIFDTGLSQVKVEIPHAKPGQPSHLQVRGKVDGKLADGLKILQEAPIGTEDVFAGWEGNGPLSGELTLDIPLAKGATPKVLVDFATQDATLNIASPQLQLSQVTGDFQFDLAKGLSGRDISLRAFGRPVTAQITAQGQGGQMQTRIDANGQIALKTLTDWLQFKQALPLDGELPYRLQVNLGSRENRLLVDSNLKGLRIDLPAPFGKAASTARDSHFSMTLDGAERRMDARYGDLAQLAYIAPAERLAEGRGELLLGSGGQPTPPTGQGLWVRGRLESLDLGAWQQQASQLAGDDPGGSARQVLQGADLSIGRIDASGMTLNQAVVRLRRGASAWDLGLDSREVIGDAHLADAKAAPLVVRLQTLRLPSAQPEQDQSAPSSDPLASYDPHQAPALNLSIDKLYRGDDLYGRVSLKLRPTGRGVSVDDIDVDLKGLRANGSAAWEGSTGRSNSWYKGRMSGRNLADVLEAWGFAPSVTSRDFHLDVDARWPGSPAWAGLDKVSGSVQASMHEGQFKQVEGGAQALRVFGLLNFDALGRRLRLDFTDLFGKGLAYDRVKALLAVSRGRYVTREPIRMTGPSSDIEIDGTLDMVRERVVANVKVALPVTNNLPLAALLVGAPVVGGALFIVDRLLGDRVARFASVNYRVVGPMKEPKITFVKPFTRGR
ncbi:YhdP family protein [Pseudomonas sp.]|uniref:YhdP family protein n=1 Tax=Pseudomonas sp. TaxID=306 RepID=UPI0028A6CF07|nr:YhdP family protein [Pseudomonas sp.]